MSGAQRQRQLRARKKEGMACLIIEVPFIPFSEALVDTGRLAEWDCDDRDAVQTAAAVLLQTFTDSVTRYGVDPFQCARNDENE